jgi:hypothetical protein
VGLGTVGCSKRRRAPVDNESGARYWVLILLSGGHDTLYTTDPKSDRDVDEIVTLPSDNQIASAGELRFGPHFAPLARWGSELTILNGVQVRTVNHDTGAKQFFHLKTDIVDVIPSALDIIATRRSGQPLGVAYLNASSRVIHSPAYFGTADPFYFGKGDLFEQVAGAGVENLAVLSKVLRRRAGDLAGASAGWREAEQTAAYFREVADFFERAADVPPLVPRERSTDYVTQSMADSLERALWLIQNDLCCGVVVDVGLLGWDTHIKNESKQAEMNGNFVKFFDDYLAALHQRSNRHGLLAERTVTVVGSELGRFPHQNDMLGKDHLPQTSLVLAGPGLEAGKSFGRTGRRMEGLSIAYDTGDRAEAGRVPLLDDVGATLLHLAGLDPERYGYSGKVCRFLLDGTS